MVAGTAVLALALYDVFATVLHHWSGTGPISRWFFNRVWHTTLRLTRRWKTDRRRYALGLVGPALIPLTVGLWAGLVVLGFALFYHPWMPRSFHVGESVPTLRSLLDAVYYSGTTFSTLGYGDVVPLAPGLRMLAILQAGSGLFLITLVISYFTSVYSAYTQQEVTAGSVFYQADTNADAARIITNHLCGGSSAGTLATEIGTLRDSLARIRSEYEQYPVLYYFRASEPEKSLMRLIFIAHDLNLLLDTAVDPAARPDVAGLGRRLGLGPAVREMEAQLVRAMDQQQHGDGQGGNGESEAAERAWLDRFRRAQHTLREAGVPTRDAADEYCRRRREWDPALHACTDAAGERWDDITGGY